MSCGKCGGLAASVVFYNEFESNEAVKCLTCGWVGWVEPVPFCPPEQLDYMCDLTQ